MKIDNFTKRPGLLLIIIAYSTFIALGLLDGLVGVAWPSIQNTFNLALDAFGLLLVAGTAGNILASFSNGRLLHFTGIATLLVLALALRGGAMFSQAAAPTWLLVLTGSFLGGIGTGMLDSSMNTFAAARFRPRLLNWLHASFAVGASLGAFLMATLLRTNLSWRYGFAILAIIHIFLSIILFFSRSKWTLPHQDNTPETPARSRVPSRETLSLPIVWISIITFFLYTGFELGIGQWSFTLALKSRGLQDSTAGLWTSYYWGSLTAGRIILGFIETNPAKLVRYALFLAFTGAGLFTLNISSTISLLGLMMVGFGLAPVFPALIALTPSRIGADHAPNAIGFQVGAAGLGGALVPALAGILGDAFNLELIAIFFFAVSVLLIIAQETAARKSLNHPPANLD